MAVTYKPLWKLLIEKGLTRTEFRLKANISTATLAKLGKDEYVAMKVIDDICSALDCEIEDVVKHVKGEKIHAPAEIL